MPYLISYLIAGIIFAGSMLANGQLMRGKRLSGSLIAILAWPLIVLVAPEAFLGPPPDKWQKDETTDPLQKRLHATLSEEASQLGGALNQALASTARRGEQGVAYFPDKSNFEEILGEYWEFKVPPSVLGEVRHARQALIHDVEDAPLAMKFSGAPPDWLVGFSTEFMKSISNTDAKLRGRILDAVAKISRAPMEVAGDTIKPLSATLSGMWRCRIGDHRLVYLPDAQSKKITLLYFGPRGDIYSKL